MKLRARTSQKADLEEDSEFESDYKPVAVSKKNPKKSEKVLALSKESKEIKKPAKKSSKNAKEPLKNKLQSSEYFPNTDPEKDETVPPIKLKNKKKIPKATQPTQDTVKAELDQCVNMESKIDLMLKMEKKPMSQNPPKSSISEISDSDSESDMESVKDESLEDAKIEQDLNSSKIGNEPIQVHLNDKKAKKTVDLQAKMERMFKALQKKFAITTLKTHLLCWLGHGFYLNKTCLKPFVHALAMSIEGFTPNKFQLENFNQKQLENFLTNANKIIKFERNFEFLENNILVTSENLCKSISNLTCSSYLQFILIVLVALRNLGLRARLCVCFDVISVKEDPRRAGANSNRIKSQNESSDENDDPKPKLKSTRGSRNSKRKSNSKLDVTSDEDENEVELKDSKPKRKNPKISDEESQDKRKPTQTKNKTVKKNNLILSNDEDNKFELYKDTDHRNYWLEVYLEEEKRWFSVEPYNVKLDCASYLEKRFDKRVLYVCCFDNDNKVKDVTKRYSSEWETNTRLLRISHLEEKKLWWERTLMFHQPIDTNLDIEEEKQLKEMLLKKPIPQSVSEFKDHPMYVLTRHLLKFQAIYPTNAVPITHFRNEPVYSRDNQVTLHSRQTWLKYARIVKPFEKTSKIVKGRLKRSEYKAGCRENPDLDLYGFWQTKPYEPPFAQGGIVPRNEFGNVELFQPCMLPRGCVHLRNMPNLNKVSRKLKIDCVAAVVGFDAHGGFSHAVYDGWVVCEEHKDILEDAYQEEERENARKAIEKNQERIYGNWKRLIRVLMIRERLKLKYDTDHHGNKRETGKKKTNQKVKVDDEKFEEINFGDNSKVGAKLNFLNENDKVDKPYQDSDSEFKSGSASTFVVLPKKAKRVRGAKTAGNKRKSKADDDDDQSWTDDDCKTRSKLETKRPLRATRQTKITAIEEITEGSNLKKNRVDDDDDGVKLSESEDD